jgi:eukaryotic-like serine/threonine-protein kinase
MATSSQVRIGRYRVERTLGGGGMGDVSLAHDTELGRPVALKSLAPHLARDGEFRARFLREARLAARLLHPNIVQVYDVGEDGLGPFIVMEYVDGETLAARLGRRGPLQPAEAVELAVQVCAGLQAAHRASLVHRDVKPGNILLRRDGTAKLTDFGIARALDATVYTMHGTVLGTPAYLAPEQARGEPVTGAADLYALGVVLYESLTGRRPVESTSVPALIESRERAPILPPGDLAPGVTPALEAAVMRCLAVAPSARPASAGELAEELAASLTEPPGTDQVTVCYLDGPRAATGALAATPPRRTHRSRRRPQVLAGLAAAALLAVGLGVGVGLDRSGSPVARAQTTVRHRATPPTTGPARPASAPAGNAAAAPPPPTTPHCAATHAGRDLQAEGRGRGHGKHRGNGHGHGPHAGRGSCG